MTKTGVADLPLHGGKTPRWLYHRMVSLSSAIITIMIQEYGRNHFLTRLADPFWFQALSCVLGYDWHSSGTTTVTCAALKEAIDPGETGVAILGGKGKASKQTIADIERVGTTFDFSTDTIKNMQYASKMAAKVDNAAIQDQYSLYHHVFFFSEDKEWGVIQQGMNTENHYARRYHWLSSRVPSFLCEPHESILGIQSAIPVLDMTAKQSLNTQQISLDLINDNPYHLRDAWARLLKNTNQTSLDDWIRFQRKPKPLPHLDMPRTINWKKMKEIYEIQPQSYEEFMSLPGIGGQTVKALALISDLIYGSEPSWKDPVKYSFAVGGKDGVPFPVDTKAMDESTHILEEGISQSALGDNEKLQALKRLRSICPVISS
jgi:hypothetical protein